MMWTLENYSIFGAIIGAIFGAYFGWVFEAIFWRFFWMFFWSLVAAAFGLMIGRELQTIWSESTQRVEKNDFKTH